MKFSWRTRIEIIAALIAAGLIWYYATPKPAPVGQWTQAKTAPQVAAVPKKSLQCKPVVVYTQAAKQQLTLPAAVLADKNQYVLGAAKIDTSLHPQTLTTIFDAQTGQTETLARIEPYPWLAAEQTGSLGFDYGFKNGFARVGRVTFREDLLQIKAVHLGIGSTIDTDGAYFIGAGLEYRW